MVSRPWRDVVQEKQQKRTTLIQPYLAETIDGDESILSIGDVDALVSRMTDGSLTAQRVISAYIRRYALLYQNCDISFLT